MTLNRAAGRWRNPLASIKGKKCAIESCQETATCAVINLMIYPTCSKHAEQAEKLGYDIVRPESKVKQ